MSSDLRTLFRSNSPDLKAVDVFADRKDEWATVARSLAELVAAVRDPQFDVEDLESPRRNVLVFYGVGGIGKSALSREIAEHLGDGEDGPPQWSRLDPTLGPVIPLRVDLSRQAGASFETVVLALRLAVAELGRPMPAFDLAFSRYWEKNYPGTGLREHLQQQQSFLRRNVDPGVLSEQMRSVLADVAQALALPGIVGSLVGQGVQLLVQALRERRRQVRALAGCRRVADLLEAEPDVDALSYYTHLLAWDLAQVPAARSATLVVLLDTFEDVGDRTHRDFERLIQRMAWLMPNVLFVITGRNRLQWDDERLEGQLDWVGGHHWPLLTAHASGEPRQHRVGYLSTEDCQRYLSSRLTVQDQPLMNDQTRGVITQRSHGLPLYLDLAVMRFLDLHQRTGKPPAAEEFNYDFPALVARTFRDLTSGERQVLRAVSLLDSFSVELATAAAGVNQDGPALALVERPFVEADADAPWRYRLHELVRTAIREADSTSEDRWSPGDWHRAAERGFDALGRELGRAEQESDRRLLVGCLRQGLSLSRDFGLELGWLGEAGFLYVQDPVWEPLDIETPGNDQQLPAGDATVGTPAAAWVEVLNAVASRQQQHRQLTIERLSQVLDSSLLPAELEELPRYFLAEAQRDVGNVQSSMEGMRWVADHGGRLAPDALRGLLHLFRRLGRFQDILDQADRLGLEGKKHRTLGDLWWTHGQIGLACASYARGRDEAIQHGWHGEAALTQACLAFAAALQDRSRADDQIGRAENMLTGVSIRWAELQVANARLLRDAGFDPELPAQAEALAEQARQAGLTSTVAYARFAVCFHAAIGGQPDHIRTARDELRGCLRGAEFAYLVEISHMIDNTTPASDLPRAQWVEGEEETRTRWQRLVAERRAELTLLGG